jgi:hypothetical protein
MFPNIYKTWGIANRLSLEVEGRMVNKKEGNINDLVAMPLQKVLGGKAPKAQ